MGCRTSDYLEKPALLEPTKRSNQVALQTIDIYFLTFKKSGVIEAGEMIEFGVSLSAVDLLFGESDGPVEVS